MEQTNPLATTTKKAFVPNKGFQIWQGDTYVGYVVIGEKNTPKELVADLQSRITWLLFYLWRNYVHSNLLKIVT